MASSDITNDMEMPGLTFHDRTLRLGEKSWLLPYPIHDAKIIGKKLVVIYDYMAGPRDRQFPNAVAFDFDGKFAWQAEHPGSDKADVYVEFMSAEPLVLWNFLCFRCEIDPADGHLIEAIFTK